MSQHSQEVEKGFTVSWSEDDESEDESSTKTAKLVMALSSRRADEVEACDKNDFYEDLDISYKDTCDRYEESLKTEENQRKVIG